MVKCRFPQTSRGLSPETVQLLREIKEHAERGDISWLTQKGKVYAAVEAA